MQVGVAVVMDKAGVEDRTGAALHRFMGVDLELAPGVLVPREETELLGRTALRLIEGLPDYPAGDLRVIDMCCGLRKPGAGHRHARSQGAGSSPAI